MTKPSKILNQQLNYGVKIMPTPTLLKTAVEALNDRLAELTTEATPEQLAYLSKSVQNMAGQGTILDVVALTDDKLQELIAAATAHLSSMTDAETHALSMIDTAKTDTLDEFNTTKINALSDMVTAKDSHLSEMGTAKTGYVTDINAEGTTQVAAVTAAGAAFADINDVPDESTIMTEVNAVQANLDAINDIPGGSTILTEINNASADGLAIEPDSLPFIFGILSRNHDYSWGYGDFTSQLGQWYSNSQDDLFKVLTGFNNWSTDYIGWQRQPTLHFLQGNNGSFIHREKNEKYANSSNQYQYPNAMLGVVFVKNTTGSSMTRTFYFGGSSYWSSGYEGAAVHVGTPNNTNQNKASISSISWNNIYNYTSSTDNFGGQSVSVTIPANKTIALVLYTSGYYFASPSSMYSFFEHWYIYNFRSNFLTSGLEVDVERTLKAWQRGGAGLTNTYQLWN